MKGKPGRTKPWDEIVIDTKHLHRKHDSQYLVIFNASISRVIDSEQQYQP